MPANKIRVDLSKNDGRRFAITFEGQFTRDEVLHILNSNGLLDDLPNGEQTTNNTVAPFSKNHSRFEKVQMTIQKNFQLIWFTSKDIQTNYEQTLQESISLSTVSTYLARMTKKGLLMRTGTGNSVKYKETPNSLQKVIKQTVKNKY
ncbi:MAG: hypothetical protein FWF66_06545 [Candidatus Bathyarchaeota archaeon]|jgi:hypothetical protein|nr:hypothetical protein [Candidatus Termiticorpusculum sp.]